MNVRIVATSLAAVAALAATLGPRTATAAEEPATISVVGHGTASRDPDRAVVNVALSTTDDSASVATGKNNATYAKLHAALSGLGIPESGIRTTYYNISYTPRPDKRDAPQPPQPGQVYGYTVSRTLAVTWAQTQNVGKIVDAAVASGATINSVGFDIGDRRGAYADALKAAVDDASAQAQALAAAAHVRITAVRSIQSDGGSRNPGPVMMRAAAGAMPAPPTEISSGPIEVSASVSITYAIAP
jgi:hypothetical protein